MQTAIRTALHGFTTHETPSDGGSGGGAPEGQGASGGGGSELFEPYLANVPDELRPLALEPLQKQNADFTRRFQEASEFRKQWEPYAKIEGLDQYGPDGLGQLLQWYGQLQTREGAQRFLQELAQEQPDLFPQEAWQHLGAANGWLDGEAGGEDEGDFDLGGDDDPRYSALEQQLQQMQQTISQWMGQQQMEQAQQQAAEQYERRLTELETKHGELSDDEHDTVVDLAIAVKQSNPDEPDPIGKAFERLMTLRGKREGDQIEERLERQNGPALSGGRADTEAPKLSWNGGVSPREAALARMRQ